MRKRESPGPLLLLAVAASCFGGDLIELARNAPPEFFADAVLRMKDPKIELLEEAFARASQAKEPVKLIGLPGLPPDTRELYRAKSAALGLDALSLQSRIVREMAAMDAEKAREMFESIARPKIETRPCADPFIADVSSYYDAAAAVARATLMKDPEAYAQFLASELIGAHLPNEIASYLRSLAPGTFSNDQWKLLIAAITVKLENAETDYRPFAMSIDSLQSEVGRLVDFARVNRLGGDELTTAFRKFVVAQTTNARCLPEIPFERIEWLQPRLSEDESTPAGRYESYRIERTYFQDEDSRRMGDRLNALRADRESRPDRLAEFLRDVNDWKPEGSDVDVFHQKGTVFRALIEMTPRGPDREKVIALAAGLLQRSGAETEAPAEWLWEARALVESAGTDGEKLIERFRSSANASLAVYAELGYFGGVSK